MPLIQIKRGLSASFLPTISRLFELVREGSFQLVLSRTTIDELNRAPDRVREIRDTLPPDGLEYVEQGSEIQALCDAYLEAEVVGPSSRNDAPHIAAASIARVNMIVSWNFKHIVHHDKIRGYHGVNLLKGYSTIPIYSPPEVI